MVHKIINAALQRNNYKFKYFKFLATYTQGKHVPMLKVNCRANFTLRFIT